jgi:hypothetical protein
MARVNCPICSSPHRQRIDSLLLLGWRPDKIVQTLENASITAKERSGRIIMASTSAPMKLRSWQL